MISDQPGDPGELVEVWRFRRFDLRAGQVVTSIGKATVGAIERFAAEAIPGSMERVPLHRLDLNGIYTPPTLVMSAPMRRRLERLKAQYEGLVEAEDHERLEGWSDRVDALSTIVRQIEDTLALRSQSAGPPAPL
jgi:hypothetical protein